MIRNHITSELVKMKDAMTKEQASVFYNGSGPGNEGFRRYDRKHKCTIA